MFLTLFTLLTLQPTHAVDSRPSVGADPKPIVIPNPIPIVGIDSSYVLKQSPRWWRAAGQVLRINLGIQLADRYLLNLDYARISGKTIADNFKYGWVWDNDDFVINQIGHPYQGSFYYSAARANGMNYWQSLPYCVLGSLTWELFCESDPPAINDLITTPLGGAALGEITWRLSDMVLDDRKRGAQRFWRETLALCLNPIRGLNRLISGDAWHQRTAHYDYYDDTEFPFTVSAGLGMRHLTRDFDFANGSPNLQLMLNMSYGDEFSEEDVRPYDYFIFGVKVDLCGKQPFFERVNVLGRLWGHLHETKRGKEVQFGIYQHFNYYNSNPIEDTDDPSHSPFLVSETASFGPGVIVRTKDRKGFFHWVHHAHLSGVLLGATKSDHYYVLDRAYNMGSGYSFKSGTMHQWGEKASLALLLNHYHLFTWGDYDANNVAPDKDPHYLNVPGNKGHTLMDVGMASFAWHITPHLSWLLDAAYYYRHSFYKHFDNVTYRAFELTTSMVYRL